MKCRSLVQRLAAVPKRPAGTPAPATIAMIAESMRGATMSSGRGTPLGATVSRLVEFEARFGRLQRKGTHGRRPVSEALSIPILTPALLKVSGADSYLDDRAVSFKSGLDRFAAPFIEKLMELLEVEGREIHIQRCGETNRQTVPQRSKGKQLTEKLTILPLSDVSHGDRMWARFPTYVFNSVDCVDESDCGSTEAPSNAVENSMVGSGPTTPDDGVGDIDPLGDIGDEAITANSTTLKEELAKAELQCSQAPEPTTTSFAPLPANPSTTPARSFLGSLTGTLTKERLGRLGQLLHVPDKGGCDVKLNFAVEQLTFPPEVPLREILKRNIRNCHVRYIRRQSIPVPGTPFRCDWSSVRSKNVPISTIELMLAVDPGVAVASSGATARDKITSRELISVKNLETILPEEHFELEVELDHEPSAADAAIGAGPLLGSAANWDDQLRAAEQLVELILWIHDELPSGSFIAK